MGRGNDREGTTWWSSGDMLEALPGWAARHLTDAPAPADLARSAPAAPRTRHRRVAPSRLRGWGIAVVSLAAAAAAVPLAVSTLAASDDATALPKVGTFPVVAPQTLAPDAGGGPARTRVPADAAVLPPMQDLSRAADTSALAGPTAAAAPRTTAPRRTITVDPTTTPAASTKAATASDDTPAPTTGPGRNATKTPTPNTGGGTPRSADGSGDNGSANGDGGTKSSGDGIVSTGLKAVGGVAGKVIGALP